MRLKIAGRLFEIVFGPFDRPVQRIVSSRDYANHEISWRSERRRDLGRIEHAQPPAGPSSNVNQAASRTETLDDHINCLGDAIEHAGYRLGDGFVFVVDEPDDLGRRKTVYVLSLRIELFGY